MSRKLASVCVVEEILPIEGADRIELARVKGWQCVVSKGEFNVGDFGVYFEIDSLMPLDNPAFAFLANPDKPTQTHVKLKTKRCLGQISQGLLIPVGKFENLGAYDEGTDLSDILGIEKWEPQIPAQLQGLVKGTRPWFIPKTDEERVANIKPYNLYGIYEISEKLDGSSMSVYFKDGEFGICSRNMDMTETEDNTFWKVARALELRKLLTDFGQNIVLQGELIGEGIQKNRLKIKGNDFRVFNIYDIDNSRYLNPTCRRAMLKYFQDVLNSPLQSVPILGEVEFTPEEISIDSIRPHIIKMAEGNSVFGDFLREGIVFKRIAGSGVYSFKSINNEYLLKHGE